MPQNLKRLKKIEACGEYCILITKLETLKQKLEAKKGTSKKISILLAITIRNLKFPSY